MHKIAILLTSCLIGCMLFTGCDKEEIPTPEEQGITAQEELNANLAIFNTTCNELAKTLKNDFLTDNTEARLIAEEGTLGPMPLLESEKERLPQFEITNISTGYSTEAKRYVCLFTFTNATDETTFLSTWYSKDGVTFTNYVRTPMTNPTVIGDLISSDMVLDDEPGMLGFYDTPDYSFADTDADSTDNDYGFNEDTEPTDDHGLNEPDTETVQPNEPSEPAETSEPSETDASAETSEPNETSENGERAEADAVVTDEAEEPNATSEVNTEVQESGEESGVDVNEAAN